MSQVADAERGAETLYSAVGKEKNNALQFNISFTVPTKKGERTIVSRASDVVTSGQTLAIMGPSGAGKTSLLKVLTMDAPGGTSTGSITLNGTPLTADRFKRRCALVAQEDHHWAFLTCRETIRYAADLFMPLSTEEKDREVESLLHKMGLESCADTLVGNAFMKGLSGGQMRRLSLAVILLKTLDVIILDEPTSGLDAASAASIMSFISELTKKEKFIMIFTIHQPSTSVYNSFDRIMLLSAGRMAFCGDRDYVLPYFESIKTPVPAQTNPAEFMLDLVNKDFSDAEKVDILLDTWDREGEPRHQQRISSLIDKADFNKSVRATSDYSVGLGMQITTMFRRHTLLAVRDPMLYTGRTVTFLFCTVFFAIIYIKARERTQDQILPRMFFNMFILGVPSCLCVVAVYAYNIEFNAIKREVKNGMVSPVSYLLTNTLLTIPVVFIFALFGIAIGAYGMLAFNGERFGQVLLIYALQMFAYESIAQLFAVATDNFLLGMMNFMNIWFCSFLFSGLFVKLENITWPFRIFAYILPLRYAAESIVYQEFNYQNWNNAHLCDPSSSTEDCNTYGGSGANAGWYCDADIEPCMGSSGQQVLQSLAARFYTYTKNDNTNLNMALLLAIAVGAKIGYVVIMTIKCNAVTKITDSVKTE
mmetsp:Transcript_14704/g.32159  ORF Transcript_14704/g.32159 Transcript_14704/m.32159 type:complete len:649 (-) Transcript_14704:1948-3894(-)